MEHILSAPFGARGLSAGMLAGQAMAEACPQTARVGKWSLVRALSEARAAFRLGDRAVTVLSALLSFHPGDEVTGDGQTIVFPSNLELCRRAHGISEPTLRRSLAQLVDAGLIVRRDSPNGKRYARKGEGGAIERAFGFDLKPLAARAEEIAAAARAVAAERRELSALREEVTLLRRTIIKGLELAAAEELSGPWAEIAAGFLPLSRPSNRGLSRTELEELRFELGLLAASVDKSLKSEMNFLNMKGNDSQTERHKQDSNPNPIFDSETFETEAPQTDGTPSGERRASDDLTAVEHLATRSGLRDPDRLHLGTILKACPSILPFARHGIGNWADLLEAAEKIRPALGISPDAWAKAVAAMGESGAAVTLAVILERVDAIRSPGGYLRALTAKAGDGGFTPAPLIFALLRSTAGKAAD
ncbi:plasmid replication protein RepC [Oryzibacter oryziterrae]|uniref:plasmid replication protein RepC n=1 Tax=Oryzibacter oryziterrae TaxID=2766474 RepID=UPI001EED79CF|nr:plasmid replication protein RepC [Oryzibacter oryziterrae]